MATKGKSSVPPTPPQSVAEVMLHEAYSRITDQHRADFCSALFSPPNPKKSKAQRKRETESILDFAALGWAYFNMRQQESME